MTHNITRTHIPPHLEKLPYIPFDVYRKYRLEYKTADTIMNTASEIVNSLPMPDAWYWTKTETMDWLEDVLSLPKNCEVFRQNNIDGKNLVLLEGHAWKIVQNFDKVQILTSEIRKIYKIEKEDCNRSISLPMRIPETLYFWYTSEHNGPYELPRADYWKQIKIIDNTGIDKHYYDLSNHWNRIPPYNSGIPCVRVGNVRRINPMTKRTLKQNLKPMPIPQPLKPIILYRV